MFDVISEDLSVSIVDTAVCRVVSGDVMSDVLCEDVSVSFEDTFVMS